MIGKLAFHVPIAGLAPAFLGNLLGLGRAAALLAFLVAGLGLSSTTNPERRV